MSQANNLMEEMFFLTMLQGSGYEKLSLLELSGKERPDTSKHHTCSRKIMG